MTLNDPVLAHRRSCSDDLAPATAPTSPSTLHLPVHIDRTIHLPVHTEHERTRQLPIPGEHAGRNLLPKQKEHQPGRRLPQLSSLQKDRSLDYVHRGDGFNDDRNLQDLPRDYQDHRHDELSHHHDYHQIHDPRTSQGNFPHIKPWLQLYIHN